MMETVIHEITTELADNWPAFIYIAMTLGFSICYFRERRAEKNVICARFDRLEALIRRPDTGESPDTLSS